MWCKNNIRILEIVSLSAALLGNLLIQLNAFYGLDTHSDDVAQQVLTNKWWHLGTGGTWFGPDPFLFKVPIHFLIERVFGQSRTSVMVSASVLSLSMIVLIFFGFRSIISNYRPALKNYWQFLLIFPWAGSIFSYAMLASMKNANLRTAELGLWIIGIAILYKFLERKLKISRLQFALLAVATGFLIFNDNAMVLFCVAPVAIYCCLQYFTNSKKAENLKLRLIAIFIVCSLILSKLWAIFFTLIGFHFYHSGVQFVSFDKFWLTLSRSIFNTIYLFNADVFGHSLFAPSTIVKLLNTAVLISALVATCHFFIKGKPWQRFFALQLPFLFLIYTVSGFATDVSTARYLILVPFYFTMLLYFACNALWQKRYRRLSIALLTIITLTWVANSLSSAYWVAVGAKRSGVSAKPRNQIERRVAGIAREEGLTRGFATYGYANLIDYFSGYKSMVTPVYCQPDHIQPFYLLMTDRELGVRSNNTFIISVEPSTSNTVVEPYPALNLPAGMSYACSKTAIQKIFGKADKVITLGEGLEMHIYNHDITPKLDTRRSVTPTSPIN